MKNVVILTPFEKLVLPVAPLLIWRLIFMFFMQKYGFFGPELVQHLDIFGVLVEVAVAFESVVVAPKQRVIIAMGQ